MEYKLLFSKGGYGFKFFFCCFGCNLYYDDKINNFGKMEEMKLEEIFSQSINYE